MACGCGAPLTFVLSFLYEKISNCNLAFCFNVASQVYRQSEATVSVYVLILIKSLVANCNLLYIYT